MNDIFQPTGTTEVNIQNVIKVSESQLKSKFIADMAFQIFSWKELSINTISKTIRDSLDIANEFYKILEKEGYIKTNENGNISWTESNKIKK